MANGMAAKMPDSEASEKWSAPLQPPAVKLASEKPGATTPMKTSSSKMARMVTNSSKVAAMVTPTMLRPMNTT